MRQQVVSTLIVCGTLLVLAPPLFDYFASHQVAQVLTDSSYKNVNMGVATMSSEYRFRLLGARRRDDRNRRRQLVQAECGQRP
jgi:hypothetical protein